MDDKMLLRDPELFPSAQVLEDALGTSVYSVLETFIKTITIEENLTVDWKYYNDGKSWLGKVVNKKKTILWLSVWQGFFKTGFYFTEKHLESIADLDISETIKEDFCIAKPVGRLMPMIINVSDSGQLNDLLAIVRFKKKLK